MHTQYIPRKRDTVCLLVFISTVFASHYNDAIMTTIASQITSLKVVCSTVYSDADQRKHQSSASLAFMWGIHLDRWIPRTKGQLRGKSFHLMTSSCFPMCGLEWPIQALNSLSIKVRTCFIQQFYVDITNPSRTLYSISQEICTRFCCALLCCGYAIVHNEFTWSIYPYLSGLLCWHWGNR